MFAMTALLAAPQPIPYVNAEPPKAVEPAGEISAVLLSPPFDQPFTCADHVAGEGSVVGDELGTDCQVVGGVLDKNRSFNRLYRTDGRRNEDWYSWGAPVLAPFDGLVTAVHSNPRVNQPGTKGPPPAGFVQLQRADGLTVIYAHLTDISVRMGEQVHAGAAIAKAGNNGPSYAPHVHVGAYKGLQPFQIRWDQRALAKFQRDKVDARP
jgi:hypothetical protein